jgi:hypothetical protein
MKKNQFLSLTNSKIKNFSKFKKQVNYLAKFVEQHFSKTHSDASERAMSYFIKREPEKSISTNSLR